MLFICTDLVLRNLVEHLRILFYRDNEKGVIGVQDKVVEVVFNILLVGKRNRRFVMKKRVQLGVKGHSTDSEGTVQGVGESVAKQGHEKDGMY